MKSSKPESIRPQFAPTSELIEEKWRTIAVTAVAPGWRVSVANSPGDKPSLVHCPVVLLQEHCSNTYKMTQIRMDGDKQVYQRTENLPEPRETRAVFGTWIDDGELVAVLDIDNFDVAGILPPQDFVS